MAKKTTRRVYTEADLGRLVVGDRVRVDVCRLQPRTEDALFPTDAVYEGNYNGKDRFLAHEDIEDVSFGSVQQSDIKQISVERKYLSFDPDGTVIIHASHSRSRNYNPSARRYLEKLSLLKQAGLYHG